MDFSLSHASERVASARRRSVTPRTRCKERPTRSTSDTTTCTRDRAPLTAARLYSAESSALSPMVPALRRESEEECQAERAESFVWKSTDLKRNELCSAKPGDLQRNFLKRAKRQSRLPPQSKNERGHCKPGRGDSSSSSPRAFGSDEKDFSTRTKQKSPHNNPTPVISPPC